MRIENINLDCLSAAFAAAGKIPGWNFKDLPVRAATIGRCRIYVVPAKLWAYPTMRRKTLTRQPELRLVAP